MRCLECDTIMDEMIKIMEVDDYGRTLMVVFVCPNENCLSKG